MSLIIRSSDIHSAGCFTTAPIPRGACVVEYSGPRLTVEEANRRYQDRDDTYLFGLSDGKTVVDGNGMAAFINHCCDGNCETDEIDGRIWIVAARDIAAGEELSYDYNLYDGDGNAPCHCGSRNCRGTLYAGREKRQRRPARRRNERKRLKKAG